MLSVAALFAVAAAVGGALLLSGGEDEDATARAAPQTHLEVLSEHPLARRDAERLLEERYLQASDDDEADVHCSRRVPRPAHSVRRCHVIYPGGMDRLVVVLTNANGTEVLSEP